MNYYIWLIIAVCCFVGELFSMEFSLTCLGIGLLGAGVRRLSITAVGAEMEVDRPLSYGGELLSALAGPLANFVLAVFVLTGLYIYGMPEPVAALVPTVSSSRISFLGMGRSS